MMVTILYYWWEDNKNHNSIQPQQGFKPCRGYFIVTQGYKFMKSNKSATYRKWSRTCFKLFWIPFILFMIGMLGMPDGEYNYSELPALSRYALIPGAVLFGITIILTIASFMTNSMQSAALLKNGIDAKAKILNMYETGTRVNYNPLVGLELEVTPPDGNVFTATVEKVLSQIQLSQIDIGETVNVKYDKETKAVALGKGFDAMIKNKAE